ncbi:MAG: HAD family phosphatase [Clostridia bacterium]|nr:HAD family phosphatase [Clostridia bacterium]
MIKNIVFDNGGVIVKYSFETYLDWFNFDKPLQQKFNELFKSSQWVQLSKGEITSKEFEEYAVSVFPQYEKEVKAILDVENLKYLIPPYQQTLDYIDSLRDRGYKVFLLSDIVEDTITYMKQAVDNWEDMFDGIVYSCRVGMVKKEGKVFDYLLKTFGLVAEETLFVDDTVRNLQEAEKYGIKTLRFLDPEKDISRIDKVINDAQ